ncbi:sensor histidine kinase [Paenibacillus sp. 1P07SE]|uniref:sensor histidine kinase n=1 Tax=Paenibacillus sp. 1P07SE TaxID=3132209 RepID=UPI0039A74607
MKPPQWSFSNRLILQLSLVILITFSISAYVTYRIHVHVLNDEISVQFSKANEQAAKRLDLQIRDIYRISNYIIFHPYVEQVLVRSSQAAQRETYTRVADKDELNKLLFQVKNDENKLYSLFLFDTNHNGFFFSAVSGANSRLDPELYEEIKHRLDGTLGNLIWFPTEVTSVHEYSGYRNLIVAARYMKNTAQEQYGILVMLFDETLFSEDLIELISDENANVYLYDKQNSLIYSDLGIASRAPDPGRLQAQQQLQNEEGTFLYAKSRSGQADFTLISRVSLDELHKQSAFSLRLTAIVAFVTLLLTGLLVTITGKRMLLPLHRLVLGMRRMREGQFNVRLNVAKDDELSYIGQSFNAMAEQLNRLIKEVYERQLKEREAELTALQAELTALQAQLNPHFMHNTLDTIYWRLYLQNDKETAGLVVALSEMLRYALEPADTKTTLREEMEQIDNYLAIQNIRFGHELETIVSMEEEVKEILVPRLLLQPLVENVFMHGFKDKPRGKRLTIAAREVRLPAEAGEIAIASVQIVITDNGRGMSEQEIAKVLRYANGTVPGGSGLESPARTDARSVHRRLPLGMRSVIRRISLMYGAPYGLEIESAAGDGTTIRLNLPKEGR